MKQAHRFVVPTLMAALAIVGCTAETSDPVARAPLQESDLEALRALGIERVVEERDRFAFHDAAGTAIGEAILIAEQDVVVTLAGHEVEARWDDTTMDLACDGQTVRLVRGETGAWAPDSALATSASFDVCMSALEAGRIVAVATRGDDVAAATAPLYEFEIVAECTARSTWVVGTGRCEACASNMGISASRLEWCSDGWASTSCGAQFCF